MAWKDSAVYWRGLPSRSTLVFCLAVFSLFSSFAFINAAAHAGTPYPIANVASAILNGGFACLWALAGTRRYLKIMVVIGVVQTGMNIGMAALFTRMAAAWSSPSIRPATYASINATTATVLIILGYSLFLAFSRTEAERYYSAMTEMRLSGEIHRNLVPPIESASAGYEFYGRSWPSGEVGGDLVDVVNADWGWFAYVADVSGHGVPAGILMTMTKSAVRTRLDAAGPVQILSALNRALTPLSEPNMYLTLAFLCFAGGRLEFATAGHAPILCYRSRTRTIEEFSVDNLPVALIRIDDFQTGQLSTEAGDLLVILTDGFTEIENKSTRELGVEPLKQVLANYASEPLDQIAHRLRATALAHGKQFDDQTLLLVRHR